MSGCLFILDGGRKKKSAKAKNAGSEEPLRTHSYEAVPNGRGRSDFWLCLRGSSLPFPAFLSPNFPFCPHYLSLGLQGDNLVNCEEGKNLETRLALFKECEENGLQLKPARCKCKQIMSHLINPRKVRKLSPTPTPLPVPPTRAHTHLYAQTHTRS